MRDDVEIVYGTKKNEVDGIAISGALYSTLKANNIYQRNIWSQYKWKITSRIETNRILNRSASKCQKIKWIEKINKLKLKVKQVSKVSV